MTKPILNFSDKDKEEIAESILMKKSTYVDSYFDPNDNNIYIIWVKTRGGLKKIKLSHN